MIGLHWAVPSYAQTVPNQKPLVEIGIFGLAGYSPDYPGSAQNHFHFLPLPFVIYRGDFLRVDPRSISGVFVENRVVHFDVSATGSFNTSSNNTARQGMPKLDDIGEVGPRLNLTLAHDARYARIEAELPVRAVFSTNFKSVAYRGWRAEPELAYIHENFKNTGGRLKLGLGANFATQQLMDYFYTVGPQFVTATRPQYTARAGYLGSSFDASYQLRISSRLTLFALGSGAYYGGVANANSPLLKKKVNVTGALGMTFSFYQSDKMVTERE